MTRPRRQLPQLRLTTLGIALALCTLPFLSACGDDDDPYGNDGDGTFNGTIHIVDNGFSPRNVTISVGDSVTWRWDGGNPHSVTEGTTLDPSDEPRLFDNPMNSSKSSGTFGYRFVDAGTVNYFCRVHLAMGMTGTVTVEP